jgi:hypothetical protein
MDTASRTVFVLLSLWQVLVHQQNTMGLLQLLLLDMLLANRDCQVLQHVTQIGELACPSRGEVMGPAVVTSHAIRVYSCCGRTAVGHAACRQEGQARQERQQAGADPRD